MAVFTGTGNEDSLTGGDDDDLLRGLGANDTLDGGAGGIDTLEGGAGDDRLIVGDGDLVVEALDEGTDTVVWSGTTRYELGLNVEHAVAGHADGVEIAGNGLDNDITGSDGGFGQNILEGGGGDDTLRGGSWDDSLEGGAGDDLLLGQVGPEFVVTIDRLDGGAGDDTMSGGGRYDTYWADSLGDVIIEAPTPADLDPTEDYESADRVYWTGTGAYVAPLNVEYLHLRGGATEAVGNEQANTLTSDYGDYDENGEEIGDLAVTLDGAGGDDVINGGAGLDSLRGGDGDDYVYAGDSGDTAAGGAGDDYILGDNFMNFYDFGDDLLLGEAGNDILDGNIDDDTLDGGEGNDALIGGEGNDMLTGGAGIDRFAGADRFELGPNSDIALDYVDGEDLILGDFAEVAITQDGADTVILFPGRFGEGGGTLRLPDTDATTITAEDFQEFFNGSFDDDFLEGTAGADFLAGGAGDDNLKAGGGADASDGGSGDDKILGGAGRDDIAGGSGKDTLDGGSDADIMAGGAGDDIFRVDAAGDVARETNRGGLDRVESSVDFTLGKHIEQLLLIGVGLDGAGNALANRIEGGAGANFLKGLAGDDRLFGQAGDDRLIGGKGDDLLYGGKGADLFVFGDEGDRDAIVDFSAAEGDHIRIVSATADSFDDLKIRSDGAGGALVRWAGGKIVLADVAPGSLDASDFQFVRSDALRAGAGPGAGPGDAAEAVAAFGYPHGMIFETAPLF